MADITMCLNKECKLRFKCYRYLAPAGGMQSYAMFNKDTDGECDFYWGVNK